MKSKYFAAVCIVAIIGASAAVRSQIASGNGYALEKAVVASGGGVSSNGGFTIEGTAGQSVTRQSSGTGFILDHGFWQFDLAPTAAMVSISGRVRTVDGAGLRNAVVALTDGSGVTRIARTSSFGYYRFDDVEAGQTVVLNVRSKLFQFAPRVVSVTDNVTELDLLPVGDNLRR